MFDLKTISGNDLTISSADIEEIDKPEFSGHRIILAVHSVPNSPSCSLTTNSAYVVIGYIRTFGLYVLV